MNTNAVLSGNMKFIALGDLLQILGANGSTGTLRLRSRYASGPGMVFFNNGHPINATADHLSGLEALYALFGWVDAEFEFSQETVRAEKTIHTNRMEIILDGLRMLDDGKIHKLGPISMSTGGTKDKTTLPFLRGPMVDYMYVVEEERFFDGDRIVEQGRHGNWIWVVLEGIVNIVKETEQGPITLLRVGSGAFIGSLSSFLMHGNERSVSAEASGDVQLGVLDSQRLAAEYACMSNDFRHMVLSLDRRLKMITDQAVQIHQGADIVSPPWLEQDPIVPLGSKDSSMFTILEGHAAVVRHTKKEALPLLILNTGDLIGCLPSLEMGHEPEKAAIHASKDIKLGVLNAEAMEAEYRQLSPTLKNMVDNLAASISATTLVALNFYQRRQTSGAENRSAAKTCAP